MLNITLEQAEKIIDNVVKVGNYLNREYTENIDSDIVLGSKLNKDFTLYVDNRTGSHITESRGYAESWTFPIGSKAELMNALFHYTHSKTEQQMMTYTFIGEYMMAFYKLLENWPEIKDEIDNQYKRYNAKKRTFLHTIENFNV